jgi:DNA-binding transcriptional MocR family regulator
MKDHAKILRPKYELVDQVLTEELGGSGLADWTKPKGGYFISLNTKYPTADRVVNLVKSLGVALTPAGATYPFGKDPNNTNIRIAPTRPPLEELRPAIEILALCIKIASYEYENGAKIVD